jgi:serine/threonine protein kinase/lipopolysaccharide biosynthesis regulator YciM
MSLFDLIRRKRNLLRELLTEEAATNFVKAFCRKSAESLFKVGDTIHPERFGIPLGPFQVTGLKIGGQGVIYTVLADHGSGIYALKSFQNSRYAERGMFERFMREAEIMMDIGRHPNLLRAHAVFAMNGRPYILLEYIAGSNLRQKLGSSGLVCEDAVRYAIDLCRGLAHAQSALPNFIHRDIKPDNCLVTNEGVLKISDFGQAKTTCPHVSSGSAYYRKAQTSPFGSKTTLANHWGAGTPDYMAPEQFHTGSTQDVRTDVYSFGVLLFELLTGDVPFRAETHEASFEKHNSWPLPDLRSINKGIPGTLCDLVQRCLAKSKEERPGDFAEIERELQQILSDLGSSPLPVPVIDQETPEAGFNRGVSLLQFRRYDETIRCLDLAAQDARLKTPAAIFTSVALAAKNHLDGAEEIVDRILAASPGNAAALTQKGMLLQERQRFAEAIAFFDRAIAADSMLVGALNHKAECLIKMGELDSAGAVSQKALDIEPLQNAAFRNLGEIRQRMKQWDQALECYLNAVLADPRDIDSLVQLSNELARAGRYPESIDYLERALWLAEDELNRDAICEEIFEFLGSGTERVLSQDDQDESTMYRWLVVASKLDCLDPGSLCRAADEIFSRFPRWRSWQKAELGKCLVELLDRSEPTYQLREVRHSIGRMFYELGHYDYARPVFAMLVDSDRDDAQSLYYLGACHEREGNRADALELYRRSLQCGPDSEGTRASIARIASTLGQETDLARRSEVTGAIASLV